VKEAGADPVGFAWVANADRELERLLALHAVVRGAVPVIMVAAQEGQSQPACEFLDFPGTVVLCGRTGALTLRGDRPVLAVPVEPLSTVARRESWALTMPELGDAAAPALAARFSLEPASVAEVAADLRHVVELEDRAIEPADVAGAVRARGATTLAAGVKLMRPRAGFERLVLAPEKLERRSRAVRRATGHRQDAGGGGAGSRTRHRLVGRRSLADGVEVAG
jgi:hypothetical protein